MTYETNLAAHNVKLDMVLIIDGIPVLFGTRARTHDGVNVTNPPAGTWTSVAAIVQKSIKLGDQEIDWNSMFVQPSKVSLQLAQSPAYDRYFEALRQPIGRLIGNLSKTATTITLNDDTPFGEATYVYADQETILTGTSASPSFTGCTRGCIALPGNSPSNHESSDLVYSNPPTMIGRRATLRIYSGHNDTDYIDWVGYRIAASPESMPGTWSITLDDGMSNLAAKMATGLTGTVAHVYQAFKDGSGPSDGIAFQKESIYLREFSDSTADKGGLMVSAPNGDTFLCSITGFISYGGGGGAVYVDKNAFIPSHPNDEGKAGLMSAEELDGSTIRRVYVSRDYPMRSVLTGLLSREGDATNSAWDTMYGSTFDGANPPLYNEPEFMFGAGIDQALVDITALEAFKDIQVPGWNWIFGDKPDALALDLLEEAGWALGVVFMWGTNGLTCMRFQGRSVLDASDRTLTEADIDRRGSSLKSVNDESQVIHTVTVDCNFPPGSDDAQAHVTVPHNRTKRLYRNTPISQAGTLQLKRRATRVVDPKHPTLGDFPFSVAEVLAIRQVNQRIFVKRGKPIRRYAVTLPWCNILPGQRVTLTHTRLRAFDGSAVSGLHCDVTKVARNWAAKTVTASLDEAFACPLIAPALRISAYAANTPTAGHCTLTLSTNNLTWGGGANPATYFAAGWKVSIKDRSASPMFSAESLHTVVGTNGIDQVELSTNAGFTPVAGDVVTLQAYDASVALTNTNQAQSARPADYAFMADTNFFLGASNAEAENWG